MRYYLRYYLAPMLETLDNYDCTYTELEYAFFDDLIEKKLKLWNQNDEKRVFEEQTRSYSIHNTKLWY
jgi:hypothetical protein